MMRRLWAALAVAVAPAAISLLLVLSWRERLPAQLATHWTFGPRPDGFTGRDAFIDGWAVTTVAVIAVGVAVTFSIRRSRRLTVMVTGAVSGFLAALGLLVALPNLGLDDPTQAAIGWPAALPIPLMIGTAGLAWWIHGPPAHVPVRASRPPAADLPRLGPGEPAEYTETMTHWALAATVFALLAAIGIAVSVFVTPWLGLEFLVIAGALAWLARTTVTASEDAGLVLSSGPVRHRVPIEELTGARVLDEVRPFAEFGGWGLRYAPRTIAVVQRRGPAVEAARTELRRVVITCRDPQRLAAVLNTLADRRFGAG